MGLGSEIEMTRCKESHWKIYEVDFCFKHVLIHTERVRKPGCCVRHQVHLCARGKNPRTAERIFMKFGIEILVFCKNLSKSDYFSDRCTWRDCLRFATNIERILPYIYRDANFIKGKLWNYMNHEFYVLYTVFRSVLFWDITQRWLVVLYRRFGTTYWFHLEG
jgi:hypothetical protein